MGRIDRIETEDFKSYRGRHVIGPFKQFTCIIGPNGAGIFYVYGINRIGKSNLMDAISFVLAIPIKNLRSSNLRELVFRNESQHFVARTCSVSMFYVTDESDQNVEAGQEIEFYRQVKENGQSQYKINGKAYRYEDYLSKLADCNILVKCRNFVVYQGDVQNIAARSPEDLTRLFEDLSGSADMKQQYDELRAERDRLRSIMDMNLKKKYTMISEKKLVQEQQREADEFQEKQLTLRDLRVEYFLWQLQYLQSNLEAQQAREEQLNRERELCEKNEDVRHDREDVKRRKRERRRIRASEAWRSCARS